MPRKCSVIGCRGNYAARKGEHADVNKVSVFHFPKDVERKQQWLCRIPQELLSEYITHDMVVCERHFEPRFVSRDMTCYRPEVVRLLVRETFQFWHLMQCLRCSPTRHLTWRRRCL